MSLGRRLVVGAVLGAGAMLVGPRPALGCGCHDGGPVCEAFWKTPVIFAGTVESVTPIPRQMSGPRERVRFRVLEALRGTDAKEIDIFNYSTSCHLAFAPREDWVVYAIPRDDGPGLTATTCSRTRRMAEAREDLLYARSAFLDRSPNGLIIGRLTYRAADNEDSLQPAAGIPITLAGPQIETFKGTTDRDGRFEIRAPPAVYQILAALPPGMFMQPAAQSVELRDGRGCAVANVWTRYPGRVTGKVVTSAGAPVRNVSVQLLSVDQYDYASARPRAVTDASGRFAIGGVEPGRYLPAIGAGYGQSGAPGSRIDVRYVFAGGVTDRERARPVRIDGGATRAAPTIVLPGRVRVAQIAGVVVHPEGRPAAGIAVRAKADVDDPDLAETTVETDARGRFVFGLIVGARYRIEAGRVSVTVDPSQPGSTIRLTLR